MTSRLNDCDHKRLRLSLEDRLTDAEQVDLAEHLEHCADCRGRLEQMAAASGYWGDAALLRGEATTGGPSTVGGLGEGPHDHECEDEFDDLAWPGASFSSRPIRLILRRSAAWGRTRSSKCWAGVAWASYSKLATRASTVRWRSRCSRPLWHMAATPAGGLPARPGLSPPSATNISSQFMLSMNFADCPIW